MGRRTTPDFAPSLRWLVTVGSDDAIYVAFHAYDKDKPNKDEIKQKMVKMIAGARAKGWGEPTDDESGLPNFAHDSKELIAKLNARFFLIVEGSGTVVEIILQGQGVLEFIDYSPEGFRLKYCNRFVKIQKADKEEWITLAKYFLDHPKRRDCRKRLFAPGRTLKPDEFNTFPGFPIAPNETGDCSLFWQHLEQNVCGGDKVVYIYLRKWIAIFQKPGDKFSASPSWRWVRSGAPGRASSPTSSTSCWATASSCGSKIKSPDRQLHEAP